MVTRFRCANRYDPKLNIHRRALLTGLPEHVKWKNPYYIQLGDAMKAPWDWPFENEPFVNGILQGLIIVIIFIIIGAW